MKTEIDKINESIKLDSLSKWLLGIAAFIVVISFLTPIIFTRETFTHIDFSETGPIGDTIGGIMNPFIAIAGILLTFLAFYIQFKANKAQFQLFRFELNNQNIHNEKQEIENRFYEMLRLHKENVNETSILCLRRTTGSQGVGFIDYNVSGRPAFELMRKEFELLYFLTKESFAKESEFEHIFNEAYGNFFHGFKSDNIGKHSFFSVLSNIIELHNGRNYMGLQSTIEDCSYIVWKEDLNFELFKGRASILAHYFRHLFQTVKYIAHQDEKLMTYEEKRKYIRLLRAQLSDSEQALLFYNWKSKFGSTWENDKNHFFTDYRMIHNLYDYILIPDIKLELIQEFQRDYKKEENREKDPLFESEDWLRENEERLPNQ